MIINTHKKGFTLVEMVVSMGIFSIVMVVAMGAFLKITEVNKRAQNVKNAVNNVNFTLEAISRELRTGKNYTLN
ncbi:MAG: type II secretion system protein, partial [Candidatus Pacebacteria bacterium]|nr:type II secretion system protein [Candidatus Paceibacterota bacterium]